MKKREGGRGGREEGGRREGGERKGKQRREGWGEDE